MRTIEIPEKDWTRALDAFSGAHDGSLVSVDVLSSAIGAQPQVRDLPLQGVTAESDSLGPAITIAAGRRDGGQITHIIHAPTHVRIEQTNEGADVALEIESAEGAAIVRFTEAG